MMFPEVYIIYIGIGFSQNLNLNIHIYVNQSVIWRVTYKWSQKWKGE